MEKLKVFDIDKDELAKYKFALIKTEKGDINGGEFLPNGSLSYMFSRKSVFEVKMPKRDLESVELDLIDYGMTEMIVNEDEEDGGETTLIIYGEYESFGELNNGIEKLGLEIINGSLKYIANNKQEFSDDELEEIEVLIDKLEEDDDVQEVYTNIA